MKHRSHLRFLFEGLEGIIALALAVCSWPITKSRLLNWGAKPEEISERWPGDQLVPYQQSTSTRAVPINSPPESIWPWIVQLGLGRAGFYSYELIERIGGIPVINIESIESRWQLLSPGDEIILHPKAPGLIVDEAAQPKRICFRTQEPARTEPAKSKNSWSFYIVTVGAYHSRLLLRSCNETPKGESLIKKIRRSLEAALDFTMEQRLLRTVKRLSESNAHPVAAPDAASPRRRA
jgi:hypothetical protein